MSFRLMMPCWCLTRPLTDIEVSVYRRLPACYHPVLSFFYPVFFFCSFFLKRWENSHFMSFPPWDNGQQFQSCMILGVPSVRQWERVKVINKLLRCLECLSVAWCLPVRLCVHECWRCACNDAGVSVSERCLKGVRIVGWRLLCSQITASDKAQEKHWLYRYLSSAPYLRCVCACVHVGVWVCDCVTFLSQAEDFHKDGFTSVRYTAALRVWKLRPDWSTGRQRMWMPGRRLSLAANLHRGRCGGGSGRVKRNNLTSLAMCVTLPLSCSQLRYWGDHGWVTSLDGRHRFNLVILKVKCVTFGDFKK